MNEVQGIFRTNEHEIPFRGRCSLQCALPGSMSVLGSVRFRADNYGLGSGGWGSGMQVGRSENITWTDMENS